MSRWQKKVATCSLNSGGSASSCARRTQRQARGLRFGTAGPRRDAGTSASCCRPTRRGVAGRDHMPMDRAQQRRGCGVRVHQVDEEHTAVRRPGWWGGPTGPGPRRSRQRGAGGPGRAGSPARPGQPCKVADSTSGTGVPVRSRRSVHSRCRTMLAVVHLGRVTVGVWVQWEDLIPRQDLQARRGVVPWMPAGPRFLGEARRSGRESVAARTRPLWGQVEARPLPGEPRRRSRGRGATQGSAAALAAARGSRPHQPSEGRGQPFAGDCSAGHVDGVRGGYALAYRS